MSRIIFAVLLIFALSCSSKNKISQKSIDQTTIIIENVYVEPLPWVKYTNPGSEKELTNSLIKEIIKSKRFNVVERDVGLEKILDEIEIQNLDVTSKNNITELGKVNNIQKIILPEYLYNNVLSLKLIDVKTGKIVDRAMGSSFKKLVEDLSDYHIPKENNYDGYIALVNKTPIKDRYLSGSLKNMFETIMLSNYEKINDRKYELIFRDELDIALGLVFEEIEIQNSGITTQKDIVNFAFSELQNKHNVKKIIIIKYSSKVNSVFFGEIYVTLKLVDLRTGEITSIVYGIIGEGSVSSFMSSKFPKMIKKLFKDETDSKEANESVAFIKGDASINDSDTMKMYEILKNNNDFNLVERDDLDIVFEEWGLQDNINIGNLFNVNKIIECNKNSYKLIDVETGNILQIENKIKKLDKYFK
jgi:hypothetical protein